MRTNDLLTSIFERLSLRMRGQATRLLKSETDAEDALQEAFCRLWSKRHSIRDHNAAEGMAMVTVRNVCIDMLRQRPGSQPIDSDQSLPDIADENNDDNDTESLADEVRNLIEKHLTERDRQILILRDRNGYDFDEIATRFSMTETAVRMALSRARRTIRELYRNHNV